MHCWWPVGRQNVGSYSTLIKQTKLNIVILNSLLINPDNFVCRTYKWHRLLFVTTKRGYNTTIYLIEWSLLLVMFLLSLFWFYLRFHYNLTLLLGSQKYLMSNKMLAEINNDIFYHISIELLVASVCQLCLKCVCTWQDADCIMKGTSSSFIFEWIVTWQTKRLCHPSF